MSDLSTLLIGDFDTDFTFWLKQFHLSTRPSTSQQQQQLQNRQLSFEEAISPLYLTTWWYHVMKFSPNADALGYLTALSIHHAIRAPTPHTQELTLEKIIERSYRCGLRATVDEAFELSRLTQSILTQLKQYRLGCGSLNAS